MTIKVVWSDELEFKQIYTTYTSSFKGSYERMCSGDQNVVKELL